MKRPISVTVFAIINLIFGVLGVLFFVFWLVTRLELVVLPTGDGPNTMEIMAENPAYMLFNDVINVLGIVVTIISLAASIGMLQLAPWSRLGTIGCSVYSIVVLLIVATLNHLLVTIPMLEQMDEQTRGFARIGAYVGFGFMGLILFYHVLLIVMLSRAKVKAAFEPLLDKEALA